MQRMRQWILEQQLSLPVMAVWLSVGFWVLDASADIWLFGQADWRGAWFGTVGGAWFHRLVFALTVGSLAYAADRIVAEIVKCRMESERRMLMSIDHLRAILNHVVRIAEFGQPTQATLDEIQAYVFEQFHRWDDVLDGRQKHQPGVLLFKRPRQPLKKAS